MAYYDICVRVTKATGEQWWRVEAGSREEAIAAYKQDRGWFLQEELTAEEVEDVDLADVYKVECRSRHLTTTAGRAYTSRN